MISRGRGHALETARAGRTWGSGLPVAHERGPGIPGISLLPGERVVARLLANYVPAAGRPGYEGHLYVTSQRLLHVPLPSSRTRGAHSFAIPLAGVAGVDAAPRGTDWRDGSWRRRLRITMTAGDALLFVVWRVGKSVELVERVRHEAASAGWA